MRAAKALGFVIAAMAAVAAVSIGTAQADKDKPKLIIKKIEPEVVSGKLKGASKSCTKGRTVVLKYQEPSFGRASAAKFTKIGSAKTNKKGKWALPGNYFIGTYKAILKASKVRKRAVSGRKEHGIEEEEAEEEDDLDDWAGVAHTKGSECSGDKTKKSES